MDKGSTGENMYSLKIVFVMLQFKKKQNSLSIDLKASKRGEGLISCKHYIVTGRTKKTIQEEHPETFIAVYFSVGFRVGALPHKECSNPFPYINPVRPIPHLSDTSSSLSLLR